MSAGYKRSRFTEDGGTLVAEASDLQFPVLRTEWPTEIAVDGVVYHMLVLTYDEATYHAVDVAGAPRIKVFND